MILKINCSLFLAAIFGFVYQAQPVSGDPTFLNDIPNQEHLVKSFTESINVRTGGKDNASKR